jgi:hypothetical protein
MSQTPAPTFGIPSVAPRGADSNEGVHNQDLQKGYQRIIEGGSWKRQDVVIVLPAAKMVPVRCALSWMNLIAAPNNGMARVPADVFLITGTEVGEAYSQTIQMIIEHPQLNAYQYILTLEHDNIPPQDGFLKLVRHMEAHPEYSAISGLYWTKGEAGVPQIWGDPKDPIPNHRPQPPDPKGGLVECCGTGMGFVLWRMSMFKDSRLRRPWFKTLAGPEGVGTQDLYYWGDARKWGYRCAVACDVLVGHHDQSTGITW